MSFASILWLSSILPTAIAAGFVAGARWADLTDAERVALLRDAANLLVLAAVLVAAGFVAMVAA